MTSIIISIISTAVGVLSIILGTRRRKTDQSLELFKRVCARIRTNYSELNAEALKVRQRHRDAELPELTKAGWIPETPLNLDDVSITLRDFDKEEHAIPPRTLRKMGAVLPRTKDGSRYRRYSEALADMSNEMNLFNGAIYRILDVASDSGHLALTFTAGNYFDHVDTSYLLTIESAIRRFNRNRGVLGGPYRRYIDDPFNLDRRAVGLGINTLTIRRDVSESGFYMHRRDKNNVTEAPEVVHVVPAGEFTPSSIGLEALKSDFDLWRNIVREYAEEFLDVEDAYGRTGRSVDFMRESPFREMMLARQEGRLQVHFLGIGFDPLDWKPGLFTVCIFEARTFDRIFARLLNRKEKSVKGGKEGVILLGSNGRGIPFTRQNIDLYAGNRNTVNAGVSCLRLAWRHRVALGLTATQ